jgi:hypothetical protein
MFRRASLIAVWAAIVTSLAAAVVHAQPVPQQSQWRLRYASPPPGPALSLPDLAQQATAGQTIPFWTAQITSPLDGQTYTTSMAGGSPFVATPVNTVIPAVVIALRMHLSDGSVLDPTTPLACDSVPATTRFVNSPFFVPQTFVSNGVNVSSGVTGGTQFTSAFQRANFWSLAQGTQFGVSLALTGPPVVVDVNAPPHSSPETVTFRCNGITGTAHMVLVGQHDYDNLLHSVIAAHATPNQLAIIFAHNVVMDAGAFCCFGGYHNAVAMSGGVQTYAVGSVIDPGIFGDTSPDIIAYSHEIMEWLDDPFLQHAVAGGGSDDTTPPWGHIGVTSGCQNNLEVGDPLDSTRFSLGPGYGGYVYHTQDLTFHDWFYRTASSSTGGNYSLFGTFTSVQGTCH